MLNNPIQNALKTPKELVLLTLAICFSTPASAVNFNLNPGGINLAGSSISAETLTAGEVSTIRFIDGYGDFQENGYGFITGAQLNNGSTITDTGLAYTLIGSPSIASQVGSYSLYFQFSDKGQAAPPGQPGQITSGSFNLYAVSGQPTFSIDDTLGAQVSNTGMPIFLGTASFNTGTATASQNGLSANLPSSIYTPTTAGTSFFGFTGPASISAVFSHSFMDGGVSQTATGYEIYGGNDILSFSSASATPELQEWLMLIIGLPCITWLAKRKQAADLSHLFFSSEHAILS